jgi:hypothetical protein
VDNQASKRDGINNGGIYRHGKPEIWEVHEAAVTIVSAAAPGGLILLTCATDEIAHVRGTIEKLFTRATAHPGWLL